MTSRDLVKPSMFLVVTGTAPVQDLIPNSSVYAFGGLTLQLPSATGQPINLAITADDLADFADLASAALFKPVCLPIAISSLGNERIVCTLSDRPASRRLAQRILAVLTADTHPARPAGVSPTSKTKGTSS